MKNSILLSLLTVLIYGCASTEVTSEGASQNPASETAAQFRDRITKSNLPDAEKTKRIEDLDRMQKLNQEMLKMGPPKTPTKGN